MKELFTIGHSIHLLERFVELLTMNDINALCDVRSSPYSRHNPQFNRELLKQEMTRRRIAYIYLGAELGPRSPDAACYENGKVQYNRLARTEIFQQGLARLRKGLTSYRIALMCSEKDPLACHRLILVCRHLRENDIIIRHILEDGALEEQGAAEQRLLQSLGISPVDLFSSEEEQIQRAYDIQSERIAYILEEGRKLE